MIVVIFATLKAAAKAKLFSVNQPEGVCECVCVCQRERERESERGSMCVSVEHLS